jgi:curved DNA-binding protein CbpA
MAESDPFEELGVSPNASEQEIDRAYRRRVVERHRKGVWRIVVQLRRAQRALVALSNPEQRRQERHEREQRTNARAEDHRTRQGRQLDLLASYKQRMHEDLERLSAANAAHHADELAEIERQLELEERRVRALERRRRLWTTSANLLLLALCVVLVVALWTNR